MPTAADAGAVLGVKLASQAMRRLRRFLAESLTPALVSGVCSPWPSTARTGLSGRVRRSKAMVAKVPIAAARSPGRAEAQR